MVNNKHKKTLYVCTANSLKSKAAEAVANHLGLVASSAGIEGWPGRDGYPRKEWLDRKYGSLDEEFVRNFIDIEEAVYGRGFYDDLANLPSRELVLNFDEIYRRRQLQGINPILLAELEERGISPSDETKGVRQLSNEMVEEYDEIVGMTDSHAREVEELFPSARGKTYSFESKYGIILFKDQISDHGLAGEMIDVIMGALENEGRSRK